MYANEASQSETVLISNASPPKRPELILLAEDNAVDQRVALVNLNSLGYGADIAHNGIEVLNAVEDRRYDIVLMDCQMPDLDGYEVTKEIRQRERGRHRAWIIGMTAQTVGDREKV
jgi:CheY-like chemotaxis protein